MTDDEKDDIKMERAKICDMVRDIFIEVDLEQGRNEISIITAKNELERLERKKVILKYKKDDLYTIMSKLIQ